MQIKQKYSSVVFCILLLLHPSRLNNKSFFNIMIFWNVGQGQWITAVTPDDCLHFDFGGEISHWPKNKNLFLRYCKAKRNVLLLSHSDLDHYAYYNLLVGTVSNICWAEIDHTALPLKRVTRKIPLCSLEDINSFQRIYNPRHFKNKNDSSKVYVFDSILIPGDSSQKQERKWSKETSPIKSRIKILSVGHHGSRTSTSRTLLDKLPELRMAIVQSRFKKYGHPHKEVIQRLRAKKIPIIRTEEWGNIILEL